MIINGKEKLLEKPTSVLDLLNGYKLNRHVVVMHVNGQIIPTADYDTTYLNNNDVVQLTTIVGGG